MNEKQDKKPQTLIVKSKNLVKTIPNTNALLIISGNGTKVINPARFLSPRNKYTTNPNINFKDEILKFKQQMREKAMKELKAKKLNLERVVKDKSIPVGSTMTPRISAHVIYKSKRATARTYEHQVLWANMREIKQKSCCKYFH